MKLYEELLKILQNENLTQRALAMKLGISGTMFSLVMNNPKYKPGRKFLKGLAVHYPDVCLKYLQSDE
ncbi:helix-turn-helix domain-containing protein [Candidatus Pacearchaeota archaeon]|jgi:transcriptional regulator with XRE-family HTH domain|nr:helix-turn-helix domain-containing protein [Candidatus Pacearchaeota archaeon]